jgi:capsular exopolysaccharide synthesis family protein
MTARDFLTIFRRRWFLLVMATLIGVAVGYLTSIGTDDEVQTYTATHTLTVNNDILSPVALAEGEEPSGATVTASQYAVLIDRGPVPVAAAERLEYTGDPATLASELDIEPNDDLGTIEISYIDERPQRAERVANSFGIELVEYLRERTREANAADAQDAQADLDRISNRLAEVQAAVAVVPPPPNIATLQAQQESLINQFQIADERLRAALSSTDSPPVQTLAPGDAVPVKSGLSLPDNLVARLVLTGLIGLIVGCAIALALEGVDIRIRDREQAERAFGLPVIAEIPAMPRGYHGELVPASDRSVPLVEAYRGLATVLAFYEAHEGQEAHEALEGPAEGDAPEAADGASTEATPVAQAERTGMVVAVVSPGPSEGKTASAAHVAVAFAEVGHSVIVLDCDFHRPRIDKIFDIHQETGLRDSLAWHQGKRLDLITHAPSGVRVAPSGRAVGDPVRLLASMPNLIEQARREADIVIIDTPPVMVVSDALGLSALADAVLIVCRVGRTTRTAAERTRATLDRVGASVLGVVLTAVPRQGRSYYGSYRDDTDVTVEPEPSRREKRRRRKQQGDYEDYEPPAPIANGSDPATTATEADVVDVGTGSATPTPRDEA